MYVFNFKELEISKSFTYPSRLFEIQDNGTYVVGGFVTSTQKFHLIIYDPIKKTIIHELTFYSKVDKLLTIKNKIVFSQRHNEFEQARRFVYSNILKIMDENLNLIRGVITKATLKFVDEKNLYCVHWNTQKVEKFDWNLNRCCFSI